MPTIGQPTEPNLEPRQRRGGPRRWLRRLSVALAGVLVVAAGIAYWALDRYVFDHVEISDVAAYEAQLRAVSSTPTTAAPQPSRGAATATTSVPEPVTSPAATTVPETTIPATTVPATTIPAAPEITDTSYRSAAMSIEITEVITGEGREQLVYFVADVVVADPRLVRGGFADNKFGANIIENTSAIAQRNEAVWAINGDYYGFRRSGIVIRNGILFRDDPARPGLALYSDGRAEIFDEKSTTGEQLLADGAWNTLSFGPPLVDNGQIVAGIDQVEIDTNVGNRTIQGAHPRSAIGVIGPNHFVFIAVDGRARGYSRGATMPELAELFIGLGATEAYNLDGGGSTTMYFNGKVVNNPRGKGQERGTSDILYVAEPGLTEPGLTEPGESSAEG